MSHGGISYYTKRVTQRVIKGAATAVKKSIIVPSAIVIITMVISVASPLSNANAYRWVDEKGQVHYSDYLPTQEVDKAYSIINKEGITINTIEKAKTKEQLAEEQRLRQERAEQEQLAHKQAAYDHILLDTYTRVSDLEETRDRYIVTLEGAIKVAQHKLINLNHDLDKLKRSSANLEGEGKMVPEDMVRDTANLQSQIEREISFIRAQHLQQTEVKEKFAADIKRYKELKSAQKEENGSTASN